MDGRLRPHSSPLIRVQAHQITPRWLGGDPYHGGIRETLDGRGRPNGVRLCVRVAVGDWSECWTGEILAGTLSSARECERAPVTAATGAVATTEGFRVNFDHSIAICGNLTLVISSYCNLLYKIRKPPDRTKPSRGGPVRHTTHFAPDMYTAATAQSCYNRRSLGGVLSSQPGKNDARYHQRDSIQSHIFPFSSALVTTAGFRHHRKAGFGRVSGPKRWLGPQARSRSGWPSARAGSVRT